MSASRMQVWYGGHVQGVGFRYSVKRLAMGFELSGTVRNLPDGRVELMCEGDHAELESFREAIRTSEVGYHIRQEDVVWGPPQGGFRGFEIVR